MPVSLVCNSHNAHWTALNGKDLYSLQKSTNKQQSFPLTKRPSKCNKVLCISICYYCCCCRKLHPFFSLINNLMTIMRLPLNRQETFIFFFATFICAIRFTHIKINFLSRLLWPIYLLLLIIIAAIIKHILSTRRLCYTTWYIV